MFIATSDGIIFKPKQVQKSIMPKKEINKGKDTQNATKKKSSKGSNPKIESIVKGETVFPKHEPRILVHSEPSRYLVHYKPPQNTVPPRKFVVKQPSIEYDFWINE